MQRNHFGNYWANPVGILREPKRRERPAARRTESGVPVFRLTGKRKRLESGPPPRLSEGKISVITGPNRLYCRPEDSVSVDSISGLIVVRKQYGKKFGATPENCDTYTIHRAVEWIRETNRNAMIRNDVAEILAESRNILRGVNPSRLRNFNRQLVDAYFEGDFDSEESSVGEDHAIA